MTRTGGGQVLGAFQEAPAGLRLAGTIQSRASHLCEVPFLKSAPFLQSYDSLIMLSITYETHNIRVMILPIDANPCWPRGLVPLSDRGQSGHDALSGTRDRAPPLPGAWPLACRARRLYATIAGRLTAQSRSQACLGPGVVMRPAASLPVSPFGYKIPAKSLLIACRALLESARRTSASL